MISLKDEFKGGEVPYVLDVGDGIYVESAMPAPVADEVARRAKDVRESGRDGFGLMVDGKMMFPAEMFLDDEEGGGGAPDEAPKPERKRKPAAGGQRCRR